VSRRWGPRPAERQVITGSVVFGDSIQISHVGGDVTVSVDRPPYRVVPAGSAPVPVSVSRARAQPSRLLLARHQVVPFTGRERTLDDLAAWIGGAEPVAALLVHGAGGQGKTRLAGEVTAQCAAAGWVVWQVVHMPTPVAGAAPLSRAELPTGAVLAVVDYADRWPASALLALLTQLRDLYTRARTRVRVLMLARSDGYWWPVVADRADSDLGIVAGALALPALAADSDDDRPGLFSVAAAHFAAALNVEHSGWPVPDLTGDGFGQVLAVHMAALATVDATRHGETPPVRADAVSAYLLRREQVYWQQLHTRTEEPMQTPPAVMHRTVVTATLTGVQPRITARQALGQAGFASSTTTDADRIIDDHTTCYPPTDTRNVFEPLHPDRLGEDLIALSSTPTSDPVNHSGVTNLARDWAQAAITNLLATGAQPPAWAATAVTVLVETARRWPHIATGVLYPLIHHQPGLVITAGGAALTRLTGIPGIDPTILESLEPLLPADRHIDLDVAAAAITSVLTRHRLANTTDPAEQAHLHATHARRLSNAGQRNAALSPACQAVFIYRRLAEVNPDAYLPDLAMSLTNLGLYLFGLGRSDEALVPAEQAVDINRRLAEANPDAYLPDLAASLTNLGMNLSRLGRREQGLALTEEAAGIRRRLAEANPDAYLPDLAASLTNLGSFRSEVGHVGRALAPAEQAVDINRRLAEANPDAHLPDLAGALTNLGLFLSRLGRRVQALAPAEQAADIYRRLAEANPDAYLPDLAASLTNLGMNLSRLGRREQGLALTEEAAGIRRRLAEANPDAYLPDLAMSLSNLGAILSELGRGEQGLALTEEAVGIRRRLAEVNPDAYLPDQAMSLGNLGMNLSRLGRHAQALAPTTEAVDIYRRLAEANPDAYLPDLAMSLSNLGAILSELGRGEQGLALTEEAVGIRRRLAEVNPDTHLPDLAASLANLDIDLSGLGRHEDALAPAAEAVRIRRRLAVANPDTHLPDLAASLTNLGTRLSELGRREEVLAPAAEAVDIYRRLADVNPDAHLPDLAASLGNLGMTLFRLDHHAQALAPAEQAVDINRQLTEINPDAYLLDLATSLGVYASMCVTAKAHLLKALDAVTEAIDIHEMLAEQLPQKLAEQLFSAAYWTLVDVLDGLGRVDEAAELRRQFDKASGDAQD